MLNVAIAEDDFRVALVHERFLEKVQGVTLVGKALTGAETMELLQQQKVDLLLLDIYMPDELGTDLLPKVREHFPDVDIIMITAATEKKLLETSIRNGVVSYLIKPVSLERFVQTIEDYKQYREKLTQAEQTDINQSVVDKLFHKETGKAENHEPLPKGIDTLTLTKVKTMIEKTSSGMTAEELGKQMGASRTTARRYLEYLLSVGQVHADLEYGIVGRPERKYYPSEKPS
ncbi:MAG TPA: response regulator [Bacillales bacterium]|nr:response regulator [Bacillales bacterium]